MMDGDYMGLKVLQSSYPRKIRKKIHIYFDLFKAYELRQGIWLQNFALLCERINFYPLLFGRLRERYSEDSFFF